MRKKWRKFQAPFFLRLYNVASCAAYSYLVADH
jgi:hypothetical protein